MVQDCGHSNICAQASFRETILKGEREARNKLGKKWRRIVSINRLSTIISLHLCACSNLMCVLGAHAAQVKSMLRLAEITIAFLGCHLSRCWCHSTCITDHIQHSAALSFAVTCHVVDTRWTLDGHIDGHIDGHTQNAVKHSILKQTEVNQLKERKHVFFLLFSINW